MPTSVLFAVHAGGQTTRLFRRRSHSMAQQHRTTPGDRPRTATGLTSHTRWGTLPTDMPGTPCVTDESERTNPMSEYGWTCPRCGSTLIENPRGKPLAVSAGTYEECRRHCPKCRIGLSNAKRPTFARADWRDGLWNRASAPLVETACNNRIHGDDGQSKLRVMQWERSEDLLTWNVFEHLERAGRLSDLVRWATAYSPKQTPQILYWGWSAASPQLRHQLEVVLEKDFGEQAGRRSEPDVMLWADDILVMFEAKFNSPNPMRSGGRESYMRAAPGAFTEGATARSGEHEQLVRNWAIGNRLVNGRSERHWLINLVPQKAEREIEASFRPLITSPNHFRRLSWEDLAKNIAPELTPLLNDCTDYFGPAFSFQ